MYRIKLPKTDNLIIFILLATLIPSMVSISRLLMDLKTDPWWFYVLLLVVFYSLAVIFLPETMLECRGYKINRGEGVKMSREIDVKKSIATILRGIACAGTVLGFVLISMDVDWMYQTGVWIIVTNILWFVPSNYGQKREINRLKKEISELKKQVKLG